MSLRTNYPGPHFKDIWLLEPHTVASSSLGIYNPSNTRVSADTTAYFTGMTSWGVQDNTDWTSNTYKSIYSHTGSGLIYAIVLCTAGGNETSTVEITIDGVFKTMTVNNASGERAAWLVGGYGSGSGVEFTTALAWLGSTGSNMALDASGLSTIQTGTVTQSPLKWNGMVGLPALRYDNSCLIRAKHSASITNSTATSYSAVMVRKGISA